LLSSTVTLTAAQIHALNSTPVQQVPAPGANQILALVGSALVYNFGSKVFQTQGNPVPVLQYQGSTDPAMSDSLPPQLLTRSQSGFNYSAGGFSFLVALLDDLNRALELTDSANYNAGPIANTTLGASGSGYAAGDTGTITQGANDATYVITSVGALGVVTSFMITASGNQYVVANGVATATGGAQPGAGIGLTVNITAVTLGDGTLKVVSYYQVVSVP
jgi:hypothetical protein